MNEEINKYIYYKSIIALIFTDKFNIIFDEMNRIDELEFFNFLKIFSAYVDKYKYILDDQMRQNIVNVANHFRVKYANDNSELKYLIFETCNSLISIANSSEFITDELIKFVADQLYIRGYNIFDRLDLMIGRNILNTFKFVKALNVQDFWILCTHCRANGSSYVMDQNELSQPDGTYIRSILCILTENSNVWYNENFRQRVIEINNLMKNNIDKTNNANVSRKVLKKDFKRYDKKLKKIVGPIEDTTN